jgi:hypothetical protein
MGGGRVALTQCLDLAAARSPPYVWAGGQMLWGLAWLCVALRCFALRALRGIWRRLSCLFVAPARSWALFGI